MELIERIKLFSKSKSEYEELEKKVDELKTKLELEKTEIIEQMEKEDVTSLKIDEVGTVFISLTPEPNIIDEERFHKFILNKRLVKTFTYIKYKIGAVRSWVRDEYYDQNKAVPPGIEVSIKKKLSIRKS